MDKGISIFLCENMFMGVCYEVKDDIMFTEIINDVACISLKSWQINSFTLD